MIRSGDPWGDRVRGEEGKGLGLVPLAARMADGSAARAVVAGLDAFAMIWDPVRAPELLARAVEREERRRRAGHRQEEAERLLLLDFQSKRGALLALSGGLWSAPEKALLSSPWTRQAWINAWRAGARRVDGLGVERCDPPAAWRFDAVNPRDRARSVQAICWARAEGFLSAQSLSEWAEAISERAAREFGGRASSLHESAELCRVDVERMEIELASLLGASSSKWPRL